MLFNCFEGFNEGIIGREAEMRGYMVKCGEKPLERLGGGGRGRAGGWRVCEISARLPMNNGAMKTVEYI